MRPLLDFRKGDSNTALRAFLTLLGTTAAHTLLETARDALFLARLPASRLAWMILAIAACGLVLSRFDRGRSQHFSTWPLLLVAAGTGAFGLALHATVHPGVVMALYLWTGVAAAWIMLRFWLALGARFTISDGKRLFGFIGLGSVLGAVVGAACARGLAFVIDARGLVLAAGALFLVTALGPARALARGDGAMRAKAAPARARAAGYELRADPYAMRILALVLLGTVALTLVDYLFKAAAQARFHQGELVAFFATASFVMSALALVVQVFGSGWLLRVIGVHRALLVLPVLVVFGASAFAVTGTVFAALLMKGADGSLRHSLHRTSVELLFLPMADEHRARVKPVVDLVGQRGGQAVASAAILLVAALGAPRAILVVVVVALGAAWVFVTLDVRRHYLDIFRATLRESHLDPEATRGLESSAAAPALADLMLDAPEEVVRHRSLRELAYRHAEDPSQRIPEVALSLAADRALRDAFASLEARVVLAREEAHAQLVATLREREAEATSHLFRVLDLWHPHENFDRVHRGLRSDDPRTRASSRELCEHVVAPAIRGALLALIDDLSDEERLERASSHFPPARLDAAGQLRVLGFPSPAAPLPVSPFVGVDLRGHDLSDAVLAGADFTGADLRGCRLRGAMLNGATLLGTRLAGADLTGAHLEDANLMGAQLERAVLEGARLSRGNWLGASAKRAILSRCIGEEVRLTAAVFEGADFGYATLRRCDVRSSDLRATRLVGANFEGSDFTSANLARANLRGTLLPR
ncbi:pentapeptide repeat-containing protein [Pendulispora rubella]|uniref:Pentapeptide repeat-containing protein n=1 Tax=Pendulispora rubella TaxID=2741070 RepID=A0ABZ2KRV2_9BACT